MANEQLDLVTSGKVVTIHYVLRNDAQEILDRSDDEPLMYLHGSGNIVPGLERELEGKRVGDRFSAEIAPADGYGERIPGGPKAVPRDAFPEDIELESGMQFVAEGPHGQMIPLWIAEVHEDRVMVDPNHPLAGETLFFEIEIASIRDATAEEEAHGHPHGPGDDHH